MMYNDMMDTIGLVDRADPELAAAMNRELTRQRENIELIASENIVSPAVMAAMGSVLTNKYAEGLPGKRYYGASPGSSLPAGSSSSTLPNTYRYWRTTSTRLASSRARTAAPST